MALILFGFQVVASAQCNMGTDVSCGSDTRQEIVDYVNCVISSMPRPPYNNNPRCGWNSRYSYTFSYYVDGDSDVNLDQLESGIASWLYNIFGGVGGGRSVSVTMSCNDRKWNTGTINVWIVCN